MLCFPILTTLPETTCILQVFWSLIKTHLYTWLSYPILSILPSLNITEPNECTYESCNASRSSLAHTRRFRCGTGREGCIACHRIFGHKSHQSIPAHTHTLLCHTRHAHSPGCIGLWERERGRSVSEGVEKKGQYRENIILYMEL